MQLYVWTAILTRKSDRGFATEGAPNRGPILCTLYGRCSATILLYGRYRHSVQVVWSLQRDHTIVWYVPVDSISCMIVVARPYYCTECTGIPYKLYGRCSATIQYTVHARARGACVRTQRWVRWHGFPRQGSHVDYEILIR